MNEVNNKLIEKDKELKNLNEILKVKESNIRKISVAHTQFKQQLETVREELLYNQNEKENLSRKLTTIEKWDGNTTHMQNESLRDQNRKLLQTLMKLLKSNDIMDIPSSKKVVKRNLSKSMKNSTILLGQTRKLSPPSPSKKRKTSKRKIKRRKSSSGTRKPKLIKNGKNMIQTETSPYPLIFNQLTPLMSSAKDKNLQMYTQKFRTDKQDLHDAKSQINTMQKYISALKIEASRIKDKYRRMRKELEFYQSDPSRKKLGMATLWPVLDHTQLLSSSFYKMQR